MALTATQVKQAKAKDKQYKLYDERGLFIIVRPNSSKWWRFKYRFADKHREISLGVYPDVSLKDARDKRDSARKQLTKKLDPSMMRQADSLCENSESEIPVENTSQITSTLS